MMRCEVFTDPLYNGEKSIEFEPSDVVAAQERDLRLLLRPKRRVTVITLRNGDRYMLDGSWSERIQAAQAGHAPPSS